MQQLAVIVYQSEHRSIGLQTNRPIPPDGAKLTISFADCWMVAKLTPLTRDEKIDLEFPEDPEPKKPVKLTDLTEGKPARKFTRRSKTTVKAVTAAMPHTIREQLIKKHSMTIVQLCKALRIEPSGANRQLVLRTLKGMKDVVRHGVKNSTWNIKVKKIATRTIGSGPQPSPTSGQTLERKVEDKPISQHITLARVDGFWKDLYKKFGNEPITGEQAAEVWGVIPGYAVQLLRHMCYLGCADNLPKESKDDHRKFFLVGTLSDPTRDLLHRTSKNGAATSEPPPTVTKRPSIGAAIRARRAKA